MASPGNEKENEVPPFDALHSRLQLTHYCDVGNRPRMRGTISPDGKTVDFELVDVAGGIKHGYMSHVTFTFIDPDHHTEEWTSIFPGGKTVRSRINPQRTK